MFKETGVEGGKLQIDKWVGSFLFFESTVHLRLCKMVYNESVSRSVCPTLCDPVDCRPPGSSVHGFLQARILEWVDIPFSRGSSQPRDWTQVSCIAGGFLTIRATREAPPPQNHLNTFSKAWSQSSPTITSHCNHEANFNSCFKETLALDSAILWLFLVMQRLCNLFHFTFECDRLSLSLWLSVYTHTRKWYIF